jgi:hypothetical protein
MIPRRALYRIDVESAPLGAILGTSPCRSRYLQSKRSFTSFFRRRLLVPIDLAGEMAAARKRRDEKTARLIRDSRVCAIQASVRPGSSRAEIEEHARAFYPRLRADLLEEAVSLVCDSPPTPALG